MVTAAGGCSANASSCRRYDRTPSQRALASRPARDRARHLQRAPQATAATHTTTATAAHAPAWSRACGARPVPTSRELERQRRQAERHREATGESDELPARVQPCVARPRASASSTTAAEKRANHASFSSEPRRSASTGAEPPVALDPTRSSTWRSYGARWSSSATRRVRTTERPSPIASIPTTSRAARSRSVAGTAGAVTHHPLTSRLATAGGSGPSVAVSGPACGTRGTRRAHTSAPNSNHPTAAPTAATNAPSAAPWKPSNDVAARTLTGPQSAARSTAGRFPPRSDEHASRTPSP